MIPRPPVSTRSDTPFPSTTPFRSVEMALSSPLLDDIELHGAQGLLVNVTCDESLSLEEYEYISARVSEIASDEADAKIGMSINPNLNGELRVTVVATGLKIGSASCRERVWQYV